MELFVVSKPFLKEGYADLAPKLETLDKFKYDIISVNETAKELGIKSFDCALPQPFVDRFHEATGFYPAGHFVWSYDNNGWGMPVPVTSDGVVALKIYNHINGE